jgi:uncharacterized protein YyaL (SSP411 family)
MENNIMEERDNISLRRYIEILIKEYKEAHKREHELLAENVSHTKENLEFRLETMNQFRNQINNERGSFITMEKFEAKMEMLERLLDNHYQSNERRISAIERTLANLKGRWIGITSTIGFVLFLLEILFRFVFK